ncbi:MAG: sulfur carrier protein ThiS [Hydrocarboniphaga effusa]|nr:sulfur carrier protein ThiS [Hydrocarboniphaga effusa]
MQITLNGQLTELADRFTLDALVQQLRLTQSRIAIELNGEIIPRSQAAHTEVKPGDRVEIVHAIGGG